MWASPDIFSAFINIYSSFLNIFSSFYYIFSSFYYIFFSFWNIFFFRFEIYFFRFQIYFPFQNIFFRFNIYFSFALTGFRKRGLPYCTILTITKYIDIMNNWLKPWWSSGSESKLVYPSLIGEGSSFSLQYRTCIPELESLLIRLYLCSWSIYSLHALTHHRQTTKLVISL